MENIIHANLLSNQDYMYRTIATNIPHGDMFIFDENLFFTIADGSEMKKHGLSKDYFEGKSIYNTFSNENIQILEPIFKNVFLGDESSAEIMFLNNYYIFRTVPIFNEENKVIAGMALSQNITGRKHSEISLKRSLEMQEVINSLLSIALEDLSLKELLQKILNKVLDIPWLSLESKGLIFLVNTKTNKLDLAVHNHISNNILTLCNEVEFGKCLCGRVAVSKEILLKTDIDDFHEISFDGIEPHGHYIIPIISENSILGILCLYLHEGIRPNSQTEDFLKAVSNILSSVIKKYASEDLIRTMEYKYRELYNNMKSGVAIFNIENNGDEFTFFEMNTAAEQIDNVKKIDVIGKNIRSVFQNIKRTGLFNILKNVAKTGNPEHFGPFYFEGINISGWREYYIYKLPSGEIITIYEDITDQILSESKLKKSNRALKILSEFNISIAKIIDENVLLDNLCKILVECGGYGYVTIFNENKICNGDFIEINASYSILNENKKKKQKNRIEFNPKNCIKCELLIKNKIHYENDIKESFQCECHLDKNQFSSFLCLQLIDAFNITYGFINLYSVEKNKFDIDEVQFLKNLSKYIIYGIETIRIKIKRLEAEELLALEKKELSITLKSISDGVITTDLDGYILIINKAAENIFRNRFSQVKGLHISKFLKINDDNEMLKVNNIFKIFNNSDKQKIIEEKIVLINQENEHKTILIQSKSIFDKKNEPQGILFIIRDLTEKIRVDNQLALSQKMQSIGQLASGIAHEINTPLQYIGDNTFFLRNGFKRLLEYIALLNNLITINSEIKEDFNNLNEELKINYDIDFLIKEIPISIEATQDGIERVSRIVKALKNFAHPSDNSKTWININKEIEITRTITTNEWKYYADCITKLDPNLPDVNCVPYEINQVLLNMIINATHAIVEKNEKTLKNEKGLIILESRKVNNFIEIIISDTGTGISEENLIKIFDPFFTTKEVGKGTGQGLAIVHDIIVNKHNGFIYVDSKIGDGTTFTIQLPLTENVIT